MSGQRFDFIELLSDAQLLEIMLFACPDGVIVTNADDRVVLYTGAAESLFGFAPIDVMHQPACRLFAEPGAYQRFRQDVCGEGAVVSRELAARRADGGEFPAAISASPLRERDGEDLGAIFYVREQRRAA